MQDLISELAGKSGEVNHPDELGAWLLPVSQDVSVAVGRYELKYIEYVTAAVTLPGLPAYCEQGFMWRNRFIPALDVQSLVTRRRMPPITGDQLAAIVAYENASSEIEFGAILLRGIPKLIGIMPHQSVAISELQTEWQLLAQAAFHTMTDRSQTLGDEISNVDVNIESGADSDVNESAKTSEQNQSKNIYPVLDLRLLFDKTPADLLALH